MMNIPQPLCEMIVSYLGSDRQQYFEEMIRNACMDTVSADNCRRSYRAYATRGLMIEVTVDRLRILVPGEFRRVTEVFLHGFELVLPDGGSFTSVFPDRQDLPL